MLDLYLAGIQKRQEIFEKLKKSTIKAPFLSFLQLDKLYILRTISSETCIGVILTLNEEGQDIPIFCIT